MNTTCTNGIGTARAYIERGWSPVPIPPREKAPTIKNWQNLRLTTSQVSLFAGDRNIGVLLGAPSGLLVDVDLDHPLAVELADRYLPTTGAEFGRASKQRSHRLYRLTAPADTQKWQTSDRKMIVELRGTGCQTVFPHSTHPSGERIDWSIDGEPAQVDPDTLRQACAALAAEVLHQLGETSEHKRNESPRRNGSVGHGSRAKIVDRARKYIGKMPPGISGQGGHDATLAAACELFRFGLTDSEAAAVLDEFNQRCEPQWSDKELAHKLDDAREKVTAAGEFGSRLGGTKRTPKRSRNEPGSSCKRDDIDVSRLNFPEVPLPSSETTIRESAEALAKLLAETGRFFTRGSVPMRMTKDDDGQPILEPIRPAALCSDLESVARLVKAVKSDDGFELVPANCSESNARLILGADVFRAALPPINIVSRCPVLLQRGDQLVAVVGYDRESGVFASGSVDQDISFDLARQMFCDLFLDSSFTTPGDRARALAAVITPAMVAGNLLRGRAPIDLGEADQSQAGKGFRNKLTAAIYGCTPRMITQRSGGVGSLNETFDKALIGGAFIIAFDNLRGRLDLPSLESFLTEDTY
ncbi:MAG TPA: bifunctional DNA primase/polymerase, partial [Pirellulales bacterium]|nr:bifunctional DNA primase/polymerase [Pirellulales bacterium]